MGLFRKIQAKSVAPKMGADGNVPLHRFAHGVVAIITGGADYGYMSPSKIRPVLEQMWSITTPANVDHVVAELSEGTTAWDLVRAVHVIRMSVAAGYLPIEKGWTKIAPIAQKLQRSYPSWDATMRAYHHDRAGWVAHSGASVDSPEKVEREIAGFERGVWRDMPFHYNLDAPAFLGE